MRNLISGKLNHYWSVKLIKKRITSPEGREQPLFICEKPLAQEEMHITIYGLDDLASIQAENYVKYGSLPVEIPNWNAGTLHIRGRDPCAVELKNLCMKFGWHITLHQVTNIFTARIGACQIHLDCAHFLIMGIQVAL